MAFQAGAAFVTVTPSLKDFHKQIGADLNRSLIPAAVSAGAGAGKSMGEQVRRSTSRVGADVGTSIASGISRVTARVGQSVGQRIHAGIGAAITSTGESAGLRIGTSLESAINTSMTRVEARGRTAGGRLYASIRAPLTKIGATSASIFGRFGFNATTATALAGAGAISMGVKFDAGMEQAQQGFTTMLGSAQRAKAFLDVLANFAAKTPFEFPDLVHASQRMIAFGFTSKQVIPTLTAIGDTAAGLGVGAEGIDQLVNAIGQIQAKGKVQSDELLQLTEVGVPALRILANQFGVSTAKMQQMVTAGVVPASKAVPALLTGIEKGTKGAAGQTTAFAGLMQRQSTTLVGIWSNFVDITNRRLGQLVAPALPFVKGALSGLTGIVQNGLGQAFSTKAGGKLLAGLKGLATSVRAFVTGSLVPSLRNLGVALAPTFRAVASLAQALLLPAFRALGAVLTGVVGPALRAVTGFLAAHKIALEGLLAAVAAGVAAYAALRAPLLVMTGIVRTIGVVTRLWAAGQALLNIALNANPIGLIVIALAALVAGLVFAYKHSATFRAIVQATLSAVATAARAVGQAALWLWHNAIQPAFNAIMLAGRILFAVLATAVLTPLMIEFNLVRAVVLALWQYAIGPAFRGIAALALWLWQNAMLPAWHGIQAVIGVAVGIIKVYIAIVTAKIRAVGAAATWLWRNAIVPAWHGIGAAIQAVYGAVIHPVLSALNTVLRSVVAPVFRWIYSSVIKPTWQALGAAIRTVWSAVISPTFGALKAGVRAVRDAFSVAVSAIGKIWKGIESATKKPVQFVVDVVYNHGIAAVWNKVAALVHLPPLPMVKFARGGVTEVLPGYTPGRDPHLFYSPTGGRIAMSGGEAIFRPEFTRAVGADFVYTANNVARKRGVSGVRDFLTGSSPAFARGGIAATGPVQHFAGGGILGALEHAGSLVIHGASHLLDAGASAFAKHLLNPVLSKIPGADSTWAKAILGLPRRMVDDFLGWLKKAVDPKLGGDPLGVVAAAKKYVGRGDDRGRDNDNIFTRMWGYPPGTPWCALFVSTAIKDARAGRHYPGYPTAAVAGFNSRMRHVPITSGRPGDLGVYGGGAHVNLIERKTGGGYLTIGGNQNALVQRRVRGGQTSMLRPNYARGGVLPPRLIRQIFHQEAPRNADPHEMDTPLVKLLTGLRPSVGARVFNLINRRHLAITDATFDAGGMLQPGLTLAYNATRRPEPVLTGTQWDALTAHRGGDTYYHNEIRPQRADFTVQDLEALNRRQEALARLGRPH